MSEANVKAWHLKEVLLCQNKLIHSKVRELEEWENKRCPGMTVSEHQLVLESQGIQPYSHISVCGFFPLLQELA